MAILSFFKSLIQSLLRSLGLYQKQGSILLLGLDNAGKTTLLHKLRTNKLLAFSPTERPHMETFYMEDIKFIGWDLGGHEAVRHLWSDYAIMDSISAVLFMIDAADVERLEEVRDELDFLVNGDGDSDGGLRSSQVPLAILLNKCDLENAQASDVIAEGIAFEDIIEGYSYSDEYNDGNGGDDEYESNNYYYDKRMEISTAPQEEMVKIFRISVWKGEGYQEAFRWISSFL